MSSSKLSLAGLALAALACSKSTAPGSASSSVWAASDLGLGRCTALNASGQVAGVDESTPTNATFLIAPGGARTGLGVFQAGSMAVGVAINTQGIVAGYSEGPSGRTAIIYSNGAWSALAGLTDAWSVAAGIDDAGDVVGMAGPAVIGQMHGFQWTAGAVSLLPVSATLRSAVAAAGPSGRSAGIVEATNGDTHAFALSRGTLTELATLGGKNASAYAMDSKGNIVGSSETAAGPRHAALFPISGAPVDLGLPSGAALSEARGIDEQGRIAGNAVDTAGISLPYQFIAGKAPVPLSMPADFTSAHIAAVAANGLMTGWGTTGANDGSHCILWTPGN